MLPSAFSTKIDAEEYVIAILMNHPYLYIHFEPLRALVPQDQLLFKILNVLNIIFMTYLMIQELSSYYVMGACANYHHELAQILHQANVRRLYFFTRTSR